MATYIAKYAAENGLRKVNAKHNLVVSVQADDVKKGSQKDSECCAFARAIYKKDKAVRRVFVFRSVAWVETAMLLTRYSLPPSVQKEIVSFDRFKTMEPGVYSFTAPTVPSKKAKTEATTEKRPARRGAGVKKFRHVTTNVRIGLAPRG